MSTFQANYLFLDLLMLLLSLHKELLFIPGFGYDFLFFIKKKKHMHWYQIGACYPLMPKAQVLEMLSGGEKNGIGTSLVTTLLLYASTYQASCLF